MVPTLVPPESENTTVAPPVVSLFPAASLAWSVSVALAPEATNPLVTVSTEAPGEGGPGTTAICGSAVVTVLPLIVAPMVVAVPASTPMKVAV